MRNDFGGAGADDSEMRESLNPITAERLLDGAADTPPALAALLARAAAAGRASELTGEATALAAFQAAGRSPAPAPTHVRSRPARRRRWLVAVAAAVFTFASAGVAVAAATGILPNPLGPNTSAPATPDDSSSRSDPAPGNPANPGGPTAPPPDAAVDGLCRAYLAQSAAGHKDELGNPRFDALVQLAGGADKVAAYCTERLAEPTADPTHGRSDNHPTGPPPTPPGQQPNKQPAK